jgi:long-chain fatty acid transport protein
MSKSRLKLSSAIAAAMLVAAPATQAGPWGYDLGNNLGPASQALAGTSLARPQDTVSSVFGNPATLTQFKGTQFTVGATFYMPEVYLEHDGSVTGAPFHGDSGTEIFPVPEIAVTQDLRGLNIPATLGIGFTATSGIGSEWRHEPESLGAGAEFIILGVNAALGYEITDKLSLGAAATISLAQMDLGLASTSAEDHTLGLRGTLGVNYDFNDSTTLGGFYQTKQKHTFDDLVATSVTAAGQQKFSDVTIEQPANIGIGIANSSLLGGDLLLMADLTYKYWENADFWQDLYKNQTVFSVGAQYTVGKWKWRIGYAHANDPTKKNASAPIGNLTQVSSAFGVIPLSDPVVQYLQATQTEVIYENRIGLGFGYTGFLMPNLDADVGGGWEFKNDRCYGSGSLSCGGHTYDEVYSWHVGGALTWRF